jgi:hypothetical protein
VVVHFLTDHEVSGPIATHQSGFAQGNNDLEILIRVATKELGGEIIDE